MTTRPAADTLSALSSVDWDFADAPSVDPLHALHPYPAKFIPEVPRHLIAALSSPGDTVLDPFSGGGTTAVEALRAGRRFHGIDANPLAAHITRVKSEPFGAADHRQLVDLAGQCENGASRTRSDWAPAIPNQAKWYADDVFDALVGLRAVIDRQASGVAKRAAMLVFANVAAKASYQESETRYVSKPRTVSVPAVKAQLARELRRTADVLVAPGRETWDAAVVEGDSRIAANYPSAAHLAVTSPPYPNAFDYHLYHRFRLFWLGPGPLPLRRVEIGSHLKHQTEARPEESYLRDMTAVMQATYAALAPGAWFALVVGDGLYRGQLFETARELAAVAEPIGYEVHQTLNRRLPTHRRSVAAAGRRLLEEQILLLRRPEVSPVRVTLEAPGYALYPYERTLRRRELAVADGVVIDDELSHDDALVIETTRSGLADLRTLAFSSSVRAGDEVISTSSRLLEGAPRTGGRRKNSTYLSHGIHRYKGKFYPQLAKSLINASGLHSGDTVLDPFGGSGTVALEATLAGIDAVSMDCNPVAISTARAKTDILHIDPSGVRDFLRGIESLNDSPRGSRELGAFRPDLLDELRSWFPVPVLVKLDRALAHVRAASDERLTNLGHVLISDLIREVSQQEPKDLRIRRRAEPITDAPLFELLAGKAATLRARYEHYLHHARPMLPTPGTAEVVFGDSANAADFSPRSADALVSSPPYAAALPYIDTDRLSIAAVYGYGQQARKPLESTMIGSREIGTRERVALEELLGEADALDLPSSTTTWLTAYLEAVLADPKAGFRRRQAPAVLTRYFVSMSAVLANARSHLRSGAHVWLVLGDSKSTIGGETWVIPTVAEVLSIAKHHGYEWVENIPITVTREDRLHSRNAIVENQIIHLRWRHAQP